MELFLVLGKGFLSFWKRRLQKDTRFFLSTETIPAPRFDSCNLIIRQESLGTSKSLARCGQFWSISLQGRYNISAWSGISPVWQDTLFTAAVRSPLQLKGRLRHHTDPF